MTLEELKTEKLELRAIVVSSLKKAYEAQSYNAWGKSVNRASIKDLKDQLKELDAEIAEIERKIAGKGSIRVTYGVPK